MVVTDSRKKRNGGWIENLGYYNPCTEEKVVKFNEERLQYWLGVGAKMSERVQKLTAK